MSMSFDEALNLLRRKDAMRQPNYREACEAIADNLSDLPYQLFICLPGGMGGNDDPAWSKVKAASSEICNCGNERVFEPLAMRTTFEPSQAQPVTMSLGDEVFIRPVGAPAIAAYSKFEIVRAGDDLAWVMVKNPLMPGINFEALFSNKGFPFAKLAEQLAHHNKPLVLCRDLERVKAVPIVSLMTVDLDAGTMTFQLDAGVEVFDPKSEALHTH